MRCPTQEHKTEIPRKNESGPLEQESNPVKEGGGREKKGEQRVAGIRKVGEKRVGSKFPKVHCSGD